MGEGLRWLSAGYVPHDHLAGADPRTGPPRPPADDAAQLAGPPPGHPERLVPDLAMSAAERELWAQLDQRP